MSIDHIQHLIEGGELAAAAAEINDYELMHGEDAELYSMRAAIAVYEGHMAEAEQYIRKGLALDPGYEDLLFNMGYVQEQQKKETIALRYYQRIVDYSSRTDLIELSNQRIDECYAMLEQRPRPLVSIVVLAYNKLDYTKMCIESIYKYTSHIDFEFITVNNGSTDETRAYFDALPANARPIHLLENKGPVVGFNEGMRAARGKYTACVCNDFIFTPRWMDNLLACIESDPSIGFVSPGASFISNYQQINGSYTNIGEMLEFAEQYNHSDPRKWEERVRLLPCVLMAPTELLAEVGYYDTKYYFGEFADDDIGFRIRRAGYKLVFCRDTFTYHFGSVTTRTDQVENNSLQVSRNIFIENIGIDVWSEGVFHPGLLDSMSIRLSDYSGNILGINAKCGGNPLQLRNMLKERGFTDVTITNYCTNPKYVIDIKTVSDELIEGSLEELAERLTGRAYKYVLFENDGGTLLHHPKLLANLIGLLEPNGQLACVLSYSELREKSMQEEVEALMNAGLQVHFTQAIPNALNGYDLLITTRKGV